MLFAEAGQGAVLGKSRPGGWSLRSTAASPPVSGGGGQGEDLCPTSIAQSNDQRLASDFHFYSVQQFFRLKPASGIFALQAQPQTRPRPILPATAIPGPMPVFSGCQIMNCYGSPALAGRLRRLRRAQSGPRVARGGMPAQCFRSRGTVYHLHERAIELLTAPGAVV